MKKILFIGDLNTYGRGYQRYRTLQDMGHDVVAFSHTDVSAPGIIENPSLLFRVFWKLRIPLDTTQINRKIRQAVLDSSFDIVWIEKGNMIWPSTLRYVKSKTRNTHLVSCSEDDMYAKHGHSLWYRFGLRIYDVVWTTKTYNLLELKLFGAKDTKLFLDSYDENTHKPMTLSEAELKRFSCDVGAIGAFEQERANSLLYLARNGIKVNVWGNGWGQMINAHPNLDIKNEFLFGEDYARAICAAKINLNFLRKINRDEITSRSIEIPACGGFMLSERTSRHLSFFEEGKEAEFFGSNSELLEKVTSYLQKSEEREIIARAGRARCISSRYSMRAQLETILNEADVRRVKAELTETT
ncbi:MAG: glycosyltransferase [Polaromonas sp.]|nr:glycosyltransferase [Polaromonas sp.]MDP3751402.1 glycosyltransferase [Polaromonas sp.]